MNTVKNTTIMCYFCSFSRLLPHCGVSRAILQIVKHCGIKKIIFNEAWNITQFSILVLVQCNPLIMLYLGFIRMDNVIKDYGQ